MKKRIIISLTVCLALSAMQAQALLITPGMEALSGNETSQAQIDAAIASFIGSASLLYKQDVGLPESLLPLAGSYDTTFFNEPLDPGAADIVYMGGAIVGPDAYLLVKDGKQSPSWYLFWLSDGVGSLNWDGMETLELRDFWPAQGAISHVSIYGETSAVSEPGTMLLLGTGLACLAGMERAHKKKD